MVFCCMQFLITSDPGCAVCQRSRTTRAVAMTSTGYGLSASRTRVASSTVETASSVEDLEATLVSTPPPAGKSYDVQTVPAKCGLSSTFPQSPNTVCRYQLNEDVTIHNYKFTCIFFHVLCLCQILVISVLD